MAPAFFAFDSNLLSDSAREALDQVAKLMRDHSEFEVTIEGHCDERGTSEYNQALGDRRANAAREYLVTAGVAREHIQVISYGEERPFAEGHGEAVWALNRRAPRRRARGLAPRAPRPSRISVSRHRRDPAPSFSSFPPGKRHVSERHRAQVVNPILTVLPWRSCRDQSGALGGYCPWVPGARIRGRPSCVVAHASGCSWQRLRRASAPLQRVRRRRAISSSRRSSGHRPSTNSRQQAAPPPRALGS
jgi:peptidoglycan-associated lipoprotein